MIHGGDAIAQHPAPEHQWIGRSASHGVGDHASGATTRASPTDDSMGDLSSALPGTLSAAPGESKAVHATRLERVLRSVSDPSQAEANDVYFLGLAVAIYLACLLVAEHLNAAENKDGGEIRGHGDVPIVLEETRADQGDKSAGQVESRAAYEQGNGIARS